MHFVTVGVLNQLVCTQCQCMNFIAVGAQNHTLCHGGVVNHALYHDRCAKPCALQCLCAKPWPYTDIVCILPTLGASHASTTQPPKRPAVQASHAFARVDVRILRSCRHRSASDFEQINAPQICTKQYCDERHFAQDGNRTRNLKVKRPKL